METPKQEIPKQETPKQETRENLRHKLRDRIASKQLQRLPTASRDAIVDRHFNKLGIDKSEVMNAIETLKKEKARSKEGSDAVDKILANLKNQIELNKSGTP